MGWHPGLDNIRNVFADLYPAQDDAIAVVAEAGIDIQYIDFSGSANNRWTKIFMDAQRHEKIESLLGVARRHYPKNKHLAAAIESYYTFNTLQDENWQRQKTTSKSSEYSLNQWILFSSLIFIFVLTGYLLWIQNGLKSELFPSVKSDLQNPGLRGNYAQNELENDNNLSDVPVGKDKHMCPDAPVYPASIRFNDLMIEVNEAEFTLGDGDWVISSPEHTIAITPFLLDQFEVTNIQYKTFVEETMYPTPISWDGTNYPTGQAFRPISGISWHDAAKYCEWAGKRLPTEAEWELACKGDSSNPYPWGSERISSLANTIDVACHEPVTVGSFIVDGEEPFADILGNVSEWTSSLIKDYPYNASDGREDPNAENGSRVVRGGSFQHNLLTCSNRLYAPAQSEIPDVGFRCAMSK